VAEISAQVVKSLRERTGAGMMDCKRALAEAGGDAERAIELLRERGLAKAVKRAGRATSEGTIALELAGAAGGLVELGCETDFVAKTPEFQALAREAARAALAHAEARDPEALLEVKLDGTTLGARIREMVGRIGENIALKRVARRAVEGPGRVGGYVHAGGKLGVLVALATEATGEAVAALAKDLAMHVAAADPSPVAVERDDVPEELVAREAELFRRQAEQEGRPAGVIDKIVEGRVRKYYSEVCLLEQPFVKDPERSVARLLADAERDLGKPVAVAGFVRFRLGEASSA
jgi:elongation factor Ts